MEHTKAICIRKKIEKEKPMRGIKKSITKMEIYPCYYEVTLHLHVRPALTENDGVWLQTLFQIILNNYSIQSAW